MITQLFVTLQRVALVTFIFFCAFNVDATFPTGNPALDQLDTLFVQAFQLHRPTDEEISKIAERFFSIPNVEEDLAAGIANLASESIYRGPAKELSEKSHLLVAKYTALQESNSPEAAEIAREIERNKTALQVEVEKRNSAIEAMMDLRHVIDGLVFTGDRRVVRFIGPILAVDGFTDDQGDVRIFPPQHVAARALKTLGQRGAIQVSKTVSEWDIQPTREWWAQNRERFGPIPEALKAIDAGSLADPSRGPLVTPLLTQAAATPQPIASTPPPIQATSPPQASPPPGAAASRPTISWVMGALIGVGGLLLVTIAMRVARRG